MRPLLFVVLVPMLASGARAQQSAPARRPLAYVSGTVAAQVFAHERVLAARARLEVPAGTRTRPWASLGMYDVTGIACTIVTPRGHCGTRGTSLGVGVDATPLGAAAPVQPFLGIGLERRFPDTGVQHDQAFVHAGADFRLSRWLAPRLEAEFPSFHWDGVPVLVSAGVRLSVPGR